MALQFDIEKYEYESRHLSVRQEMIEVLDRRLRELEFEAKEIREILYRLDI